jgi:hypothetical protein
MEEYQIRRLIRWEDIDKEGSALEDLGTATSDDISDFDEAAQDAVGSILADTSTIDFTYTDATPEIKADVIQSGLDHGSIGGLSDNDHPQYLLVTDIDDTPVNGETAQPISSNWAFDHVALENPHGTELDDLTDVDTSSTPPTDGQALIWDDANSLWIPGDVAAGGGSANLVQVVHAERTTVGTTSSTTIPGDDSIPQKTEGTEFLTCAITPTDAGNKLRIDVSTYVAVNALANAFAALFQDDTANALAAGMAVIPASGYVYCLQFTHVMDAGTTSATTFKLRAGPGNSTQVLTINGSGGSRFLGGTLKTTITITEYVP